VPVSGAAFSKIADNKNKICVNAEAAFFGAVSADVCSRRHGRRIFSGEEFLR
jgi:hypothetical protein